MIVKAISIAADICLKFLGAAIFYCQKCCALAILLLLCVM